MFKEILIVVVTIILIAALMFVTTFSVASIVNKKMCDKIAEKNPQLEFDYEFYTGCLVKTPSGNWIDSNDMILVTRSD